MAVYSGSIAAILLSMTTKNTDTEALHVVPEDLESLLAEAPDVRQLWDSLTPLARNEWICWMTIVKKPETRAEHLERLKADLLSGHRRPCCWPGCPHRRPSAQKWFSRKKDA